ncbi:hypothetical protein G4G28_24245 [Massilia sp. Dwa41.01b]|uniref:hypothetical protein n=1 Tax=unclassified Massilia TaxID=2609279 RepID=UPI0016012FB8|nr:MULTISPECIES: hypothetical protein [unclassified Massilia]QNA90835.1 hypothetical protein G4G28_24245 [Massilia sp. Dwa41.01b]QNA98078.1 hypothetical protein G4G31_03345 [Massilia sp. Se16.2.3]
MTKEITPKLAHFAAMNAIKIARADKFALSLQAQIEELKASELTPHQMAHELNERGYRTPRRHYWTYKSVQDVCARLDAITKTAVDTANAADATTSF